MRLTCPNCSAQYEVPDEVIPEEGRDVQCSNCEETWFQAKNPAEAVSAPEPAAPDAATDEAPEPASPPADDLNEPAEAQPAEAKSGVDPSVASILKEEAAREAELRAKEGGGLESQPDLALEPVAKPAPATQSVPVETAADAGQKDALPDVEAINSSLRSDEVNASDTDDQPAPRKSGGFLRGFSLILIIGVLLFLIYGNAQQISEAVPQADPVLKPYVSLVDQARVWLQAQSGAVQN